MAATPTAASRRHGLSLALASLILADVSGQIIFIPASSSLLSTSSSRGLLLGGGGGSGSSSGSGSTLSYDEPPCRQRRLEPFRQLVREECRFEAETHCRAPLAAAATRDLSSWMLFPATSLGRDDERRMGSLLDAIFASPPSLPSPSSHRIEDSGEADPFERIFEEMMNWSLRAFDEASSSYAAKAAVAPPSAGGGKADPEDERGETNVGEKTGGDGAADAVAVPVPISPEIAAENALDVAVAELARRSIHRAGSGGGAVAAEAAAAPALPDVDELHDRLFRLGSGLLSESSGKRRLLEKGPGADDAAVVDPRAEVRERLARRLTEYRADLYYHPDGTVTLYTRSYDPRPRTRAAARPPLGFGDDRVDDCMLSRRANGDLGGGCLEAVDAFVGAVADRTLAVPPRRPAPPADVADPSNAHAVLEFVFYNLASFTVAILIIALIMDWVFNPEDEDNEGEEGGEFDYEMLPEVDRDLVDQDGREGGEEAPAPQVYVGVPLQVV
jgi:hypothetical protein